ncbi:MAG: lysozyme inhibitor LprI family protein, partial [Pseudomonadota bacterium]
AYFQALTLRCDGPDGLVAAVRMKSDKPEPQELVFRFRRFEPPALASSCTEAFTTLEMNECLAGILARAQSSQDQYLSSALERYTDRPVLAANIAASDKAFAAYRDAECDAVYEDWKEGSIRNIMSLTCRIEMTDARTHSIWRNWLTYQDNATPILPEPAPTR